MFSGSFLLKVWNPWKETLFTDHSRKIAGEVSTTGTSLYTNVCFLLSFHTWWMMWSDVETWIDLFRLYILFSQYRSCDDTQEIWSFVLFIKKSIFILAFILFNEQDKGSSLLSIITWSVLGKQNVQAKKVYFVHSKDVHRQWAPTILIL